MTDLEEVPNDDELPPSEPEFWSEDSEYPLADWQFAVAKDYTRMGYWQWVEVQKLLTKYGA